MLPFSNRFIDKGPRLPDFFKNGEVGFVFDPLSSKPTMFTDTGAVTPAKAAADAVAAITSIAPGGYSFIHNTLGNRPLINMSLGRPLLSFDGTNDCLRSSALTGVFQNKGYGTGIFAVIPTDTAVEGIFFLASNNISQTRFQVYKTSLDKAALGSRGPDAEPFSSVIHASSIVSGAYVITGEVDWTNRTENISINLDARTSETPAWTGGTSPNTASNLNPGIGAGTGDTTNPYSGLMGRFIIIDRELNATERLMAIRWAAYSIRLAI